MEGIRDVGALIGRILLALIFVLSGFGKVMHFSGTEQMMTAHGIPAADALLALTILVELGGGLLIVAGFQARWAALIVFLWLLPVTWVFHVKAYELAMQQRQLMMIQAQWANILKNIAIEGGLLVLASFGAGRFSVDGEV